MIDGDGSLGALGVWTLPRSLARAWVRTSTRRIDFPASCRPNRVSFRLQRAAKSAPRADNLGPFEPKVARSNLVGRIPNSIARIP